MASGRPIKGGEAYVEIGIRNRIAQGAKGVQADLDKLGRKVTALGGIVGGIGLSMATPFAFATAKLASFDDAMRATGAVSRATSAELDSMTMVAKELGRTTSFTAVEVALLMAELGRAGFKPDEVNVMTGAVLDLARATGTDAAMSAGIMAASIRQFGMQASDAARVADVLTAAANGSFNTVESLGEALKYAGPVAADFNMSIEETAALLGTLGNVGIQGSMAGTTIRRLLTITGAEADNLKEIFGVSFIDMNGNARPLVDTLGEVAAATNGLGTAAKSAKFNEAFGLLGITGASAIGKVTTDTKALYQALLSAGGQASKTAVEMDAGLGGSFRKISSAIEGSVIAIGESFGPSLQQITDSLTQAVGGITAWIIENKSLVAAVAATSVALVGAGATLIAFGVGSQVAAAGMGTLISIAGVGSSVLVAAKAVMAAYGVVVLATAATFAMASGTAQGAAIGISIMNAAYAISPAIAGAVAAAWGVVGAVLAGLAAPATLSATVAGMLSAVWTATAGVVGTAWAVITGPILPFLVAGAAVVTIIGAIVGAAGVAAIAGADFGKAWKIVTDTFGATIGIIKETFGVIRAALSSGDYATAAQALWLGLQATFWTGVSAVMDAFNWLWDEAFATGKRFFMNLLNFAVAPLKLLAKAIMDPLSAYDTIKQGMADIAGMAVGFDVDAKADSAKLALKALRDQLSARERLTDAEKEAKRVRDSMKSPQQKRDEEKAKIDQLQRGGQLTTQEATTAKAAIDAEMTDKEKFDARKARRLEEVKGQLESGEITPGQYRSKVEAINSESEAYADKVKALELEILAIEKGEKAAERAKLVAEGFTETQIRQIEVLQAKKAALDAAAEAEKKASEKKAEAMDQLREEGKALADALRTPGEILSAELKNIDKLRKAGAIDDKTKGRAVADAFKRFKDAQGGIDEEQKRVGPSGSFSAAAGMVIAMRGVKPDKKELIEIAKNSREQVRLARKERIARAG